MVYGYAGLGLAGFYYCLVYVSAVHAFATVFRQQRWVYVDDTPLVAVKQEVGYHEQEAGQSYGVDTGLFECGEHDGGVVYLGACHYSHGGAEASGTVYDAGVGTVAHDEGYFKATVGC